MEARDTIKANRIKRFDQKTWNTSLHGTTHDWNKSDWYRNNWGWASRTPRPKLKAARVR